MNRQVICETCGVLVDISHYEQHQKYGHNVQPPVSDNNKDHKCYMCGKTFTSSYNLKYHIAHHINARSFVCNECPKAYNTASDLAQHKRIHSNIAKVPRKHKKLEPQTCPICSKTVVRLTMHIKVVHMNQRNYNCEFCDKKFGKKGGLDRHILVVHKNVRNFKCDECGKVFGEKSLLTRHQVVHSSVRTAFHCTVCKKYVDEIKSHYETVHADLPYKCEYCHRRYAKLRDFNIHVSSKHTKLRKWLCDLCGSKFVEKYQLKRHFQSHMNADGIKEADIPQFNDIFQKESKSTPKKSSKNRVIKKFKCNLCGKKLVTGMLLIKHLERHQKRKDRYCNICRISIDNVKEHYEEEHNDLEYTCEICFKKFGSKLQLKNHNSSNHTEHTCDVCGKIFNNLTITKLHMDMVHAKTVKEEQPDDDYDDYNTVDQVNAYDERSDESEQDIKPEAIENVIVDTIDIKKEPEELYDETIYETEVPIKNEYISDPEDGYTYDSEIANNIKEEITIEEEKVEYTNISEDENSQDFKCTECDELYPTKNTFRDHFMPQHTKVLSKSSFMCIPCDKTYKTRELILIHVRRIHRKLKIEPPKIQPIEQTSKVCSFCGKVLTSEKGLNLHIKRAHQEKQIKCTVCDKKFSFITEMHKHRDRNHDKKRKHKCNKCSHQFASKHELRLHIEHNHNQNRENTLSEFMCYCGVSFPMKHSLTRHKRMIHGDKDPDIIPECEICKEVSRTTHLKRRHMAQVHLNGKILKRTCRFCSTEFDLYVDFKAHVDSHAGLFICITCGEFYFDAESLKAHQSTHRTVDVNLRKFICDHCGHRVFSKLQLSLHMLKHLKDCKIHYCDICGKGFKFQSSLYTHRKYHGEGEFACTQCDKKFVRNHELINHIRKHNNEKPFRCQVCDRGFSTKLVLQYHLQTHPETRVMFKCKGCNNEFVDKKQLIMHEDLAHPELRPYRCHMCCMSFRHEHNLRKHNSHKHL